MKATPECAGRENCQKVENLIPTFLDSVALTSGDSTRQSLSNRSSQPLVSGGFSFPQQKPLVSASVCVAGLTHTVGVVGTGLRSGLELRRNGLLQQQPRRSRSGQCRPLDQASQVDQRQHRGAAQD
jgi:hypothetical protein